MIVLFTDFGLHGPYTAQMKAVLNQTAVVNDYQAFLLDEAKVAQLRKRFEGYTGPVVNAGGVR